MTITGGPQGNFVGLFFVSKQWPPFVSYLCALHSLEWPLLSWFHPLDLVLERHFHRWEKIFSTQRFGGNYDKIWQANSRRAVSSRISMQALDELKLFVGGLPWAMEAEDLKQVWKRHVFDCEARPEQYLFVRPFLGSGTSKMQTLFTTARLGGPVDSDSSLSQRKPMLRLLALRWTRRWGPASFLCFETNNLGHWFSIFIFYLILIIFCRRLAAGLSTSTSRSSELRASLAVSTVRLALTERTFQNVLRKHMPKHDLRRQFLVSIEYHFSLKSCFSS